MDVGERRVRTARVVSVHDDEVIIDVGRDQGLEVGMHIDLTPPSDDDVEWEEEAVIGEVDAVEEHRARVRIRWREVASVGTPVAVTPADTTGSLVAPPGPPRSIRLRAGVIAGTPINDLGINLLVNGELELRRGRYFLARVVLRPTGMSIGQGPDFGGGGAYAQLGFDHHLIGAAVGLGVERVWDDGCCGSGATGQWEPRLTYPTSFRVGAVDGLMAEVTTLLMIEQRELRLLAVHAELQFPMRRNAWLAFRGSGGGAALFWHSEALVKLALRGNGDSGTTRLELGIGAVGTTDQNPSRSPRVGPSLVIGVHHQL
ncbi:MAG: hypothetical protein CMN30_02490 [Sandaracinus sp.]|nr:hypothetical protein [Sandaracinus sp.]